MKRLDCESWRPLSWATGASLVLSLVVTGTLIEMPSSVVIFGRVIDVQTGEVESVAQVILPRSQEVDSLLS